MNISLAVLALLTDLFAIEPRNATLEPDLARDVAKGILEATIVDWEVETLGRIFRWESAGRRDVVNCTTIGKLGERGAFQVLPRSTAERDDLCSADLAKQARIALARIRESRSICERQGFRGGDVLGVYTHGRCVRNNVHGRLRFGDGSKLRELLQK